MKLVLSQLYSFAQPEFFSSSPQAESTYLSWYFCLSATPVVFWCLHWLVCFSLPHFLVLLFSFCITFVWSSFLFAQFVHLFQSVFLPHWLALSVLAFFVFFFLFLTQSAHFSLLFCFSVSPGHLSFLMSWPPPFIISCLCSAERSPWIYACPSALVAFLSLTIYFLPFLTDTCDACHSPFTRSFTVWKYYWEVLQVLKLQTCPGVVKEY